MSGEVNPQILQHECLILLQPKHSSQRKKPPYICDLRTRIGCEPFSAHPTRSDRVTNIGWLLSLGASPLPAANQNYLLWFFSNSCILIARTFNGRPNNVMNPSASW
ncbi:Hypothetical protein EHLA_1828 [Anaerobutyricum hallii]|uniref:Uncharacterized protein n=1 Tax=Anaerobutyricum hallii TaxID=39488 RepID=A0A285PSF0_9FIRM|nr:Hypothetical protein EHLA_1828 [Anaerobutyricum hallii]